MLVMRLETASVSDSVLVTQLETASGRTRCW